VTPVAGGPDEATSPTTTPSQTWLASTRPDGRAHAAPVWFIWDGRAMYFSTGPTTEKHRNLQHQSWVIAQLGDGDDTSSPRGTSSWATPPS
jgi:Pyridoxamine 5'-phosphate oxidase